MQHFWCDDAAGIFRRVEPCQGCGLYQYTDADGETVHLSPDCVVIEAALGDPTPTIQ